METRLTEGKEHKNQQAEVGKPENLRIEYSAVCANLNSVANFRFALMALYITAVGFLVSSNPEKWHYLLLMLLTVVCFIVEWRNTLLINNIAERGRQIEQEWGYKGFISNWSTIKTIFRVM